MIAIEVDTVIGEPPSVETLIETCLSSVSHGKVHKTEESVRLEHAVHRFKCLIPVRNHRETVTARHEIAFSVKLLRFQKFHVRDITLNEFDLFGDTQTLDTLFRDLEKCGTQIEKIHFHLLALLDLVKHELDITCSAASHADPTVDGLSPGYTVLHHRVTIGKQSLTKSVVSWPLTLVEGRDVLAFSQRMHRHGCHDSDVVPRRVRVPVFESVGICVQERWCSRAI